MENSVYKVYKIYNPVTGLYSKGGLHGRGSVGDTRYHWNKNGKTWNELRHVKSHINLQYIEKWDSESRKHYIAEYSALLKQYINDKCVVQELSFNGIITIPIQTLIKDIEIL